MRTMHVHAKQKGFSFFNLLLWLIIGGFGGLLMLKVGPMYMNNMTIQAALNGLKDRNLTDTPSPSQIRSQIEKQLREAQDSLIEKYNIRVSRVEKSE